MVVGLALDSREISPQNKMIKYETHDTLWQSHHGNSHLQMIFPHKKSPVYFGDVASHTPGPSLYHGIFMMVKSLFMDEPSSNQTWQTGTSVSSMNLRTEPPFRERGISS